MMASTPSVGGRTMSDTINPYEPPKSDVGPSPDQPALLVDASTGTRFANFAIDMVARLALYFIVGVVAALFGLPVERGRLTSYGIGYLTIFLYYVALEATFGRTLGKLITGTRVVTADGRRPSFFQNVGRSLTRLVPFEPLSFAGNAIGWWHDRWSDTRVVRVR
jgi:uncharacterized RDD family membrane protein YckC